MTCVTQSFSQFLFQSPVFSPTSVFTGERLTCCADFGNFYPLARNLSVVRLYWLTTVKIYIFKPPKRAIARQSKTMPSLKAQITANSNRKNTTGQPKCNFALIFVFQSCNHKLYLLYLTCEIQHISSTSRTHRPISNPIAASRKRA